jgi:hypothetical protein
VPGIAHDVAIARAVDREIGKFKGVACRGHATMASMSNTARELELPCAPSQEERRADLVDFLLSADLGKAAALVEASELYGDDADRELADLEDGRHPVQRLRQP